jgi:hypothetical protein
MTITWNEDKRQANLKKHGLDFADAEKVFAGHVINFEDTRYDYGEERRVVIGLLHSLVVVIICTENSEVVRIISMRKATRNEQKTYYNEYTGRI